MTPSEVPREPAATVPPQQASVLLDRRARQTRMLWIFVTTSLVVHLGCFAAFALWPEREKPAIDLDQAVIKTKLVKLGKPRDEKLLPRVPTSAPPPPVDKKAPPTPEKDTAQKPEPDNTKKPSASEILERFNEKNERPDINELIEQRIGEPTDEGQLDGDRDGTALTGEIVDSYFARVTAKINRAMQLSSVLSDEERVRLKAVLCLAIDDEGGLSDIAVKDSSGSSVFDGDVLSAAQRASPVGAPPPPARDRAAAGVCFNFCPISCK